MHDISLRPGLDFPDEKLAQQLDREVALRHAADLAKKLVREDRDVRPFQPGSGEDVDDLVGNERLRDDLADRMIKYFGGFAVVRDVLYQRSTDRLEKPDRIADAKRLAMRHRQPESLRQLLHRLQQPFLAAILRENELLPRRDHRDPLLRCPLRQRAEIEAVQ